MAGLQRSAVSFRRQGSSGLVFDAKFLNQLNQKEDTDKVQQEEDGEQQQEQVREAKLSSRPVGSSNTIERSRSNGGGRAFRTGKVSPALEPSSPKVSACGLCSAFAKPDKTHRRPKFGKRRI